MKQAADVFSAPVSSGNWHDVIYNQENPDLVPGQGAPLLGGFGIPTQEELIKQSQQQLASTKQAIEKSAAEQAMAAQKGMYAAPSMAGFSQMISGANPADVAMQQQAAELASQQALQDSVAAAQDQVTQAGTLVAQTYSDLQTHVEGWISSLAKMYEKTGGITAQFRELLYGGAGTPGLIQHMSDQVNLWYQTGGQQGIDPGSAKGRMTQYVSTWQYVTGQKMFKDEGGAL